ncbi:transglutaminase family protein [Vibrio coralliilyticus]|uniref:transglutaminase-like domain-containing protein n=1 Tax=Vibrio coralliilyticus TaxID=190893 RepID=UPI000BAC2281|nr:transglutaminase family protein [Vibrio coralliilyticus]NOI74445.1 transglutaminase family protein [Vibrio coralliilyticus]PAW05041.1 transglutaminase [Vibrio coralliilyticus]
MSEQSNNYLQETSMLDYMHPHIQSLVEKKEWKKLSQYDAIGAIYNYVRDEVRFGYNKDDRLAASEVLRDGYGQCNTKGTLLMALLRAVGIATRFHGFTIYNELQRGAIPNYLFKIAPDRIIHSWVEVYQEGRWINLEGYILDNDYLQQVQNRFASQNDSFSGYAIATKCLSNPNVDWKGQDTYIQSEGIADDFGVFSQPEDFYSVHGSNLSGIKKVMFRYIFRHLMNWNVNKIRTNGI